MKEFARGEPFVLFQDRKIFHRSGIFHRDLKPWNITLLDGELSQDWPYIKLIDCGLARLKESNSYTTDQPIMCSFYYIAPEQSGMIKRNVDERSNLYSIGIILYQLLTGQLPFEAEGIELHKG